MASKRARVFHPADTKSATTHAKQHKWSSLPSTLTAHCFSFLRVVDVVAAQRACKAWQSSEQVDGVWRKLYLQQFEAESASDACIAADGETTAWRTRFRLRHDVEQHWHEGRFSARTVNPLQHASQSFPLNPFSAGSSRSEHPDSVLDLLFIHRWQQIACYDGESVALFRASDFQLVDRWSLAVAGTDNVEAADALRLDESQTPIRLAAFVARNQVS